MALTFKGTGTAVVTPFSTNGVNYDAFGRFLNWQIEKGVEFLVVLGTTGEAPTVSAKERQEITQFAVSTVGRRVPVVLGTGSNSTEHTIDQSREAMAAGADAVLVVTPYYNKPTQDGLFKHFSMVAGSINIPLIIYNVPGRTGVNILPATVQRLSEIPGIVGIKEASGNQVQVDNLIRSISKTRPDFSILSGNDDQAFHLVNAGGHGVISVLSNIAPFETSEMIRHGLAGRVAEARVLHQRLLPLMSNLFMETNPIPVKYAVSKLGYCENLLRLPLVAASEATRNRIDGDMKEAGLE